MSNNDTPSEMPKVGVVGGVKFPGSGRQKGTPNKKSVLSLETIRDQVAKELGKAPDDITATRILYLVANRGDKALGLKEGEITLDQSIDAASKLANFEVPKKRAIEVSGLEQLGGAGYYISGGTPPRKGETNEEWAARAQLETLQAEAEIKQRQLAELQESKRKQEEEKKGTLPGAGA